MDEAGPRRQVAPSWAGRRAWRRRVGWLFIAIAAVLAVWILVAARTAQGLKATVFLGLVQLPVFILVAFIGIHFLIGRDGTRRRRG